ncbi:MAG TPA: ABC-2 family transporter protein [Clostridia bacterium]|nr:ABC-2 family transporter protein [Clostridia bacterium]
MRTLRKYLLVAETSISSNMMYAANFLAGTFFFALIIFVFLQLWNAISLNSGSMEGYTVNRMVWYYIAAELVVLSKSDVFRSMNEEIRGGGIAYKLNKPYSFIAYQFSDGMGQTAVRLCANLPVGILVGFLYVGRLEGFVWESLPAVILSVLFGILLNFFMDAFIGMTAFWTEDNSAFYWIAQKLSFVLGLLLPLEFLPGVIRQIAVYLPFSYIAYAPARLLTSFSKETLTSILPVQVLYTALFAALTAWMYMKGVKKLNVNGG